MVGCREMLKVCLSRFGGFTRMNADQNNEPFQKIKKLSDKKFRVQPSGCVVAIEQAKAWTLNCLCVSAVKNCLVSVSAVSAFIRG
jgi:hypothetical protein